MLNPLINREDRCVPCPCEAAMAKERLEVTKDWDRSVAVTPHAVDDISARERELLARDRLTAVVEERRALRAEEAFNRLGHFLLSLDLGVPRESSAVRLLMFCLFT